MGAGSRAIRRSSRENPATGRYHIIREYIVLCRGLCNRRSGGATSCFIVNTGSQGRNNKFVWVEGTVPYVLFFLFPPFRSPLFSSPQSGPKNPAKAFGGALFALPARRTTFAATRDV